ncbi:LacI family DNA-binding transcriptional regulator [Mycobacterium aquaticum]|uniref:LacI family transcriptional regulator n=1 Tax=Mycobacterium aquaticum TaxID=1927124 RepID=A0A1X0B4C8_9MYCO|nr:LacI family DNA-binding transcriptional regulator [Mycobacterium aquaticum]ORA37202.1 LacI family transcriptional regulator [Mycobacterium aquaticum]
MRQKRVTLSDVAREAGVSMTTASFVLSHQDSKRISAATQDRVWDASRKLGYRPNLAARSLRVNSTMTVGMISDRIAATQYAGEMVRGAIDAATRAGRVLLIAETEDESAGGAEHIEAMLDRQVDGLIYGSMYTRDVKPPASLRSVPHVFLNCLSPTKTGPAVIPDECEAGKLAATTLLDNGHTTGVYYIGGRHVTTGSPRGIFAGHERARGIGEEFSARGLSLAGTTDCEWLPPEGYRVAREVLRTGPVPTAFICANDRLALGVYQALQDAALSVPGDVSVISFDDSELAAWLRPGLTSIALPHYDMGTKAVELLLENRTEPAVHRCPMPLSTRESVGQRR